MQRSIVSILAVSMIVGVTGSKVMAQQHPASPALAGPRVSENAARKTLVEYDFPGKVKRLDATPEEAALKLIDLDASIRAKVEKVLNERVKQLDEFVAGNLQLLTKLQTASASGDKLDQAVLVAEGVQKLSPVWMKGSLRSQIDEQLPKEKKRELKTLLDEYWDAIVKEQQAQPRDSEPAKPGAKKKARWEILVAERLASFGKEIERSFQRQLRSGDILYRYIESAVVMSPEQKGKIRELCAAFAEKTKMNPTEKQNQELFVKIAGTLDTKQQVELANLLKGLKKPAAKKED